MFINLETLMLLDERLFSNDNNYDQKKRQKTSKNNFSFHHAECLLFSGHLLAVDEVSYVCHIAFII